MSQLIGSVGGLGVVQKWRLIGMAQWFAASQSPTIFENPLKIPIELHQMPIFTHLTNDPSLNTVFQRSSQIEKAITEAKRKKNIVNQEAI